MVAPINFRCKTHRRKQYNPYGKTVRHRGRNCSVMIETASSCLFPMTGYRAFLLLSCVIVRNDVRRDTAISYSFIGARAASINFRYNINLVSNFEAHMMALFAETCILWHFLYFVTTPIPRALTTRRLSNLLC